MSRPNPFPASPLLLSLGLAAAIGLAGCGATPVSRSAAPPPAPAPVAVLEPAADPAAAVEAAEIALQRRRYREAAELQARAALGSDDETLIAEAARMAFELRQMTFVARIAEHWLGINPTNESAVRYAAFAALDQYRLDEAVSHFSGLLTAAYINPAAGFLGLDPQLAGNGSPAAVTTVLARLVAMHPDVAEGHHALGQAALRSENLALAMASARRARELAPYWSPAGLLLARMQLVAGETEAGLATAREVVDQDGSVANRTEYALLLLAAGQGEEGLAELNALATSSEESALVVERLLALRDLEAGRLDAAVERFDGLIRKGAFVYESLFFLGGIAEQRGSWEEARRNYSRIVSGDYAVAAQNRIAQLLVRHATREAALAWLADFGGQRPQYAIDMIVSRARLLEQGGDESGARRMLDAGLAEYPDSHELLMERSFFFERTDDVRAAVADLESLNAVRTGDPLVQNALGYLLVDRTRRHREGLELIEAALGQMPDNGPILDSMGWALHRLGRNEEALGYLEQARERIYDPEIELHVGDVYWALGRRDDARATWQAGSERHPEEPGFSERLKRHFAR